MTTREELITFDKETRSFYKENNMNMRWLHRFAELDYADKMACSDFFNSLNNSLLIMAKKTGRAFLPYDEECDGTEADEELTKKQLRLKQTHVTAYEKEKGIKNTLAFVIYVYLHRYYKIPHTYACLIQQSLMSNLAKQDIFLMMQFKIEDFFALFAAGNDCSEEERRDMYNANYTLLNYFEKSAKTIKESKTVPMKRLYPYMFDYKIIIDDEKRIEGEMIDARYD